LSQDIPKAIELSYVKGNKWIYGKQKKVKETKKIELRKMNSLPNPPACINTTLIAFSL